MEQKAAVIDQVSVYSATDFANCLGQDYVEASLRWMRDPEQKERRKAGECKTCYYIHHSRMGGAAMTTRPCGICHMPVTYSSTNTDKLCMDCAQTHQLCKHCGADVLLRPRRKFGKDSKNVD